MVELYVEAGTFGGGFAAATLTLGEAEVGNNMAPADLIADLNAQIAASALAGKVSFGLDAEDRVRLVSSEIGSSAYVFVRITSYNVCYTKLLRRSSLQLQAHLASFL